VLFVLEITPNVLVPKPGTRRGKDEFSEQHLSEGQAVVSRPRPGEEIIMDVVLGEDGVRTLS
jgi:hypothetical protein